MKKHLLGEDIAFNKLRINNLFLIIFSVFFPIFNLIAQNERELESFSLNGFGKQITIDNNIKLFSLFTYDMDGDGLIDIGGLDESRKNVSIYYGKGSNTFSKPVRYSFSNQYSGIVAKSLFADGNANLILYSKLDGRISIYTFYKRTKQLRMSITIECCFSDLQVINLDQTREPEIIVSGANFRGIGIISLREGGYHFKRINDGYYSNLLPFYLNSDNRVDLVGFNPFDKSLYLLRNNGKFNFSKNVYKVFNESIDKIIAGNFDDDQINDVLLYSSRMKKFYLLYGNGLGSFSDMEVTTTNISSGSNFQAFDCNRDLIDEFFSYDRKSKVFSLNYLSNLSIKYLPLISLENLFSTATYRTTLTKGIVISSSEGLFLIAQTNLASQLNRYVLSNNPVDLKSFRTSFDFYPKLIWLDKQNHLLYILQRDELNNPAILFYIRLSSGYEKIKLFLFSNEEIQLVCFNQFDYHFDYLKIDLIGRKYTRRNLAVPGKILDIGKEKSEVNRVLLNVIVESENKRVILIDPFDINKVKLNENLLSKTIDDFVFDFDTHQMYYLVNDKSNLNIKVIERSFNRNFTSLEETEIYEIKNENYIQRKIFLCYDIKNSKVLLLNVSNLKENKLIVLPVDKNNPSTRILNIKIPENSCDCKKLSNENTYSVFYYNLNSESLEKMVITGNLKTNNFPLKKLSTSVTFSIENTAKNKQEMVYISNYSIINSEIVK